MRLFSLLRSTRIGFLRDKGGGVAIYAAASLTMMLGAGAIVIDLGSLYNVKRRTQAMADFAAMAAATDPLHADDIVRSVLKANGLPIPRALTVQTGIYTPSLALKPDQRFAPAAAGSANAVKVALGNDAPVFLGKAITGQEHYPVNVEAVAAQSRNAAFAIGSRLASLNNGILNNLLTTLLGTNISLSAMDYDALASARINVFEFMDALGLGADLNAVSYSQILDMPVTYGAAMKAALLVVQPASGQEARTRAALQALAGPTDVARLKLKVGDLIAPGPYAATQVGETPQFGISSSVLSLATAAAQLANGSHQVALDLGAGIPGIANVQVALTIGERPQGGSWLGIGPVGTQAHTAQTRLLVTLQIGGSGVLSAATIKLPIYLELAAADATLKKVTCGLSTSDIRVEIDAKPGLVDAWIGDVSPGQMKNFTNPVSPGPAQLVKLPLVSMTGRAHATMSNVQPDTLSFTYADIQQLQARNVRTRDFTTSLTQRLLGDLDLNAQVLGLGLGVGNAALTGALATTLGGLTPTIDMLLDQILSTLGIGLGEADVWAQGVRCDGAVLVN